MEKSPILQISQDAADELSLERPASLFDEVSSGDTGTRKVLRALTKTCKHLAATFDWEVLKAETQFQTLNQEWQPNTIPADFLRFQPQTMHNLTRRMRVSGPVTASEWQTMKMWGTAAVPGYFRVMSSKLYLYPAPSVGEVISFEYIRDAVGTIGDAGARFQDVATPTALSQGVAQPNWVSLDQQPAPDTSVKRFTADTDRALWDDELIIVGIVAHYRQTEGLEYSQDWQRWQQMIHDRLAMDGHQRVLDMDAAPGADGMFKSLRNAAGVVLPTAGGVGYSVR